MQCDLIIRMQSEEMRDMRLQQVRQANPGKSSGLNKLENDLARLYYTGQFEEYARRIAEVPGL